MATQVHITNTATNYLCTQYCAEEYTFEFFTLVGRMSQPATAIEGLRAALPITLANRALTRPAKAHATCPALGWKSFEGSSGSLELIQPSGKWETLLAGIPYTSMTRQNMNIKEITHAVAHVLAGFLTPAFHPLPSGLCDEIRAYILPFIGWWYKA